MHLPRSDFIKWEINMKSFIKYISSALFMLLLSGCVTTNPKSQPEVTSTNPTASPTSETKVWKQKSFVLSSFFAVGGGGKIQNRNWLAKTKEAGINMVELTFLSRSLLKSAVEACEMLKLPCIIQDLDANGGIGRDYPGFTEQSVKEFVDEYKEYSCVEGYYVWDEPHKDVFMKTRELRDLFKKYAPEKLAFSCVYPSYGVYNWSSSDFNWKNSTYGKYIDEYLNEIQPEILSLNYYPFAVTGLKSDIYRHDVWRDMGYVRKQAIETGTPNWHYFQGVSDLQKKTPDGLAVEQIKVQMYAALAYGVKGLSYYTSYGLFLDENGEKTSYYEPLTKINNKVKAIGDFLLDKKQQELYHSGLDKPVEKMYFLDSFDDSTIVSDIPNHIIMGVFHDDDNKNVLVLVNKNYNEKVKGTMSLKNQGKVSLFDAETKRITKVTAETKAVKLEIPPGDCTVYILET